MKYVVIEAVMLFGGALLSAQEDPGPRLGPALVGGALPGLTANQLAAFDLGKTIFQEVDSVTGSLTGSSGLGPRFNSDSCVSCHAHPEVGGSSPAVNPQYGAASKAGAQNTIPSFLSPSGPVRVARFLRDANGNPDYGVHDLFVVTGRSDAPGCNIAQPDFAGAIAAKNIALRIPTPVFGVGLIEAIGDAAILANKMANGRRKSALGISGRENRNANDGSLTRFGWKAQNKSLMIFAGEAYNVEQGVTNEVFPQERESAAACRFNATPEDHSDYGNPVLSSAMGDVAMFTMFMRSLAPPARAPSVNQDPGESLFNNIGCALCHTPTLMTGPNTTAALSSKPVNLFSDLLLHAMGSGLADGVEQGYAEGNEFRTAPLWGLGKRLFFLHDGRAADLVTAIAAHSSPGSEANGVIGNYNALNNTQKQSILNFLRSL